MAKRIVPITQQTPPAPAAKQAPAAAKAGAQKPQGKPNRVPPSAGAARPRKRHAWMLASFILVVLAPLAVTIFYLFTIASDQYISKAGFAVRAEELSSAADLLGSLSSVSGTSSSDTDILNEFIHSQDMVERVLEKIDLVEAYTVPAFDPVFAYRPTGQIEDLVDYWRRMVELHYDQGTALIELRVHAFRPEDAKQIAEQIVEESSLLINRLSAIARDNNTRYARVDLETAQARLRTAREALTKFRSENRTINLEAAVQGQIGILNSLEQQLAKARIDLNLLLLEGMSDTDRRMVTEQRRITVIENLIDIERAQFGKTSESREGGINFSNLAGEFERLTVDLEYAQQTYLKALAALDSAIAEAERQNRYLAPYTHPSMPQSARYPDRFIFSAITAFFLLLIWSIGVLVYYSVRDRR
ncbi:sugar transporter [Sulfitobacter sp. F26169L]|uniref:sugar transporter n=1 Tax=Sulfitobacter sp. F26169L TaxID=2996015 RepID=UPI002261018C|nr:sugar transporter [Sulfitobacter sp. F26169L]MCX7568051.1 sugar transporter [Sulfitobacter sp. F26169L]